MNSHNKFITLGKTDNIIKRIKIVVAALILLEVICVFGLLGVNSKVFSNTQNLARVPSGTVEVVLSQDGNDVNTHSGKHMVNKIAYVSSWAYDKDKTNWITPSTSKDLDGNKSADLYYSPDSILFKRISFANVWWQYTIMYIGFLAIILIACYQINTHKDDVGILDIVLVTVSSVFYLFLLLLGFIVLG